MKQHPLTPAALAILQHLATQRRATSRELILLQRALNDGRSEASRQAQPYNLMRLGYVEQATATRPVQWRITPRGMSALEAGRPLRATRSTSEAPPPPPTEQRSTQFTYAGRTVQALAGPRWAFDLANTSIDY